MSEHDKSKSSSPQSSSANVAVFRADSYADDDERVPGRKQIGLFSAVFIIFNRIIGTGWVWEWQR